MMWAAIFLFALGFSDLAGIYVDASPGSAVGLWLVATACLLVSRIRADGALSLSALVGTLTLGLTVLASQTVFFAVYERIVVGVSELSWLSGAAAAFVGLLGLDVGVLDGQVHVQTQQQLLSVSVTPEKLGLPFVGLVAVPAVVIAAAASRDGYRSAAFRVAAILVATGVYALLRLSFLTGLVIDYGRLDFFWRPIWLAVSFAPMVLVLAMVVPLRWQLVVANGGKGWREAAYTGFVSLAVALLIFSVSFRLPAPPTAAKVLIDDAHSDWAWTDMEFGRESFTRQATYSYTDLVRFLGYHYDVHVNHDRELTPKLLEDTDVLVLKTPTQPYSSQEVSAVQEYVSAGGGLFLIGDHTNLFGMTTNINPVAERFGLRFSDDATYDLQSGQPTRFRKALFDTHPIAQFADNLRYETSCSIVAPPYAEHVLVGYGLGSELVDYSHINFFGNMKVDPQDRFGMLLQGAAVPFGEGRVFAFSDSTIFSNFSVFQEGRAELALAALEYVRGSGSLAGWVRWLLVPGVIVLAGAGLLRTGRAAASLRGSVIGVAVGVLAGTTAVAAVHAATFELPAPVEDYPVIAFDRQFSQFRLPSMIDTGTGATREKSFDAFFVATQRLGFVPRIRRDFSEALRKQHPLVLINPVGAVYESEADAVPQFLAGGGRLLILVDDRGPFHTVNALLSRLEMGVVPRLPGSGVRGGENEVFGLRPVELPEQLAESSGSIPEIYGADVGRGRLVLVVGAQYFSQEWMGPVFNNPDDAEKDLYLLEYHVIEHVLMGGEDRYVMR